MKPITNTLTYQSAPSTGLSDKQQATIREALCILETHIRTSDAMTNSEKVRQFCLLQSANERDEHFSCLFLDNQHRLIAFERLFSGTIDGAAVYPRVVLRRALELNAAALILTHNHPSGIPEPSQSDISITRRVREAMALVDIRVLDHVVAGAEGTVSMAERGLI